MRELLYELLIWPVDKFPASLLIGFPVALVLRLGYEFVGYLRG